MQLEVLDLMWPYVLYFFVGGTLVTAVAMSAHTGRHDGRVRGSLPVLFIINVLLLYQNGGVSAGLSMPAVL
jgi:hypothetical protein